jgi:oligoendopeptidase F
MNKLTEDSINKYYGDVVNKDEYIGLSWARRSHYFMNHYMYAYSMCISIASYVASEILKGNKDMLNNYIKFLSTGSNVDNVDIFGVLGIDITDKNVYIKAIDYFDSMIDRFVELNKEGEVDGK